MTRLTTGLFPIQPVFKLYRLLFFMVVNIWEHITAANKTVHNIYLRQVLNYLEKYPILRHFSHTFISPKIFLFDQVPFLSPKSSKCLALVHFHVKNMFSLTHKGSLQLVYKRQDILIRSKTSRFIKTWSSVAKYWAFYWNIY